MATKTEVEQTSPAQVPALYSPPPLDITSDDIALPRIYIGQFMSQHVKDKAVNVGDVYAAAGPDDGDPQVLWASGSDAAKAPVFHVLSMQRGLSATINGELQRFKVGDPSAPEDAWITYNYVVALPEVDPSVPYKFLLTKTGRPAAKQVNLVLSKNAGTGPAWNHAFALTSAKRENQKGEFYVARVQNVEAKPENIAIANELALMVSGQADEYHATGEEPAI